MKIHAKRLLEMQRALERDTAAYFAMLSAQAAAEEANIEAAFDRESSAIYSAFDPDAPLEGM
jgi:hypothetical protein